MMEFEEDHEEELEEEEEEEDEDEEMAITPTFKSSSTPPTDGGGVKKPAPIAAYRYRECLKNHAVGIGGHAVDGCGEFMPAGVEGSLDALKCAACNCHRNFHRKELLLDSSGGSNQLTLFTPRPQYISPPPSHHHPPPPQQVYQFYPYNRTSAASPTTAHFLHPRPLALPSPTTATPQDHHQHQNQTQNQNQEEVMMMMGTGTTSSRKKRFRTKFSQEQKDKMLELAEQLGWRIQKQDEAIVQNFCEQTGVRRHVLKVWMHNNKHTLGKKNPSLS